ncbi:hypothetical protein [Tropicimonas sp.]|uniref:hypothetical protein n=1 Tax=Tropicimonas sp. TaxID=2067044 RepID=UPI003A8A3F36
MSDFSTRLWRSLGNIVLAMLNATLILIALCLFLGLRLAGTVNDIATNVTQSALDAAPLREEVREMTDQIAGLRSDLAAVGTGELADGATGQLAAIDARLDTLQTRAAALREQIGAARLAPERAIAAVAGAFANEISALANCTPSIAPEPD